MLSKIYGSSVYKVITGFRILQNGELNYLYRLPLVLSPLNGEEKHRTDVSTHEGSNA
jgi:hypothetical protein